MQYDLPGAYTNRNSWKYNQLNCQIIVTSYLVFQTTALNIKGKYSGVVVTLNLLGVGYASL